VADPVIILSEVNVNYIKDDKNITVNYIKDDKNIAIKIKHKTAKNNAKLLLT